MILILTEKFDRPTENVIFHLKERGADFAIIYASDLFEKSFQINLNDNTIWLNNKKLGDINIIWYRRWLSRLYEFSKNAKEHEYLKKEFEELSANFMYNLKTKRWLNTPPYINSYPTKAYQLKVAKNCGLRIPDTIITNNITSLKEFHSKKDNNIITKNLSDPYIFNAKKEQYATYTTFVEESDISKQKNLFFPSLFQSNISKNIEIRVFYFLKNFYSYARFSSQNKQTSIDFRVYDYNHPNRIMKYELPKHIKEKLIDLMDTFNLNTGSIDLIKDSNNMFYFLEVNPQGQFGGLTEYGLNIEMEIANYLIKNDK